MKKIAKKLGRPSVSPVDLRDQRLDVRFSRRELKRLKQTAAASGMRWSDWVRQRLGQDSRAAGE